MFESEGQAKHFFVEKIVAQAGFEGQSLSEDEQWMLSFSESDPEFVVDPVRVKRLESKMSDKDYEPKVAGLLQRSYKRDVALDSRARAIYRDAYAALGRGDHYLVVMIEQALGSAVRAGHGATGLSRALVKSGFFVLLVLPASFTMLIAAGLLWIVVSGQAPSVREAIPFAFGALVFAGISYYMIRLWCRESRR